MKKPKHKVVSELEEVLKSGAIDWTEMKPTIKHTLWRWIAFKKNTKVTLERDIYVITNLCDQRLLKWDMLLDDVTEDIVIKIAETIRNQSSAGNSNKYISILQTIFKKAMMWQLGLSKTDCWRTRPIFFEKYAHDDVRRRVISREEQIALLNELPEHLIPIVKFCLLTGLRKSNVVNLRWENVNFFAKTITVHADEFKTRQTHNFPMNTDAIKILKDQQGIHERYVFTYKGNRIRQPLNTAFKNACKRAGITNLRFHDFRRTFATRHLEGSTPLHIVKRLGGWKSTTILDQRYAVLCTNHLEKFVGNSSK